MMQSCQFEEIYRKAVIKGVDKKEEANEILKSNTGMDYISELKT